MKSSALAIFNSLPFIIVYFEVSFVLACFLSLVELSFDTFSYRLEDLWNINVIFGTAFYELNSEFLSQSLALLKSNLSIFFVAV